MKEADEGIGAMVAGVECRRGKEKEERTLSFVSVLVQGILIRLVESHLDSLYLLFCEGKLSTIVNRGSH
jgi:hypothetical protein